MSKEEKISNALKELYRAIDDIKKKYGDAIDTDFLQDKMEDIIKKIKSDGEDG